MISHDCYVNNKCDKFFGFDNTSLKKAHLAFRAYKYYYRNQDNVRIYYLHKKTCDGTNIVGAHAGFTSLYLCTVVLKVIRLMNPLYFQIIIFKLIMSAVTDDEYSRKSELFLEN